MASATSLSLTTTPARRSTSLSIDLLAAGRAVSYGLAYLALRRLRVLPSARQRRDMMAFWRDIFVLTRTELNRPGMRAIIGQLERQDWRDFPLFAATLPLDLLRAERKRRGLRVRVTPKNNFPYPQYYLHDFHNQYNGGLSARAAATYEWQIRMTFGGTNRLMRQRVIDALPPGAALRILDVGCGTAAWLPQARMQGRQHHVTGVDLSPDYLAVAKARGDVRATFAQHNGETLPPEFNGQFDCAVCIWVYHELPSEAQHRVTAAMASALKPGGKLLFLDAMQPSDLPERDIAFMSELFAEDFDEPYFAAYQELNIARHFEMKGLKVVQRSRSFVSTFYEFHKAA